MFRSKNKNDKKPDYEVNAGNFLPLPNEILTEIIQYLNPSEKLLLSLSCHFFHDFVKSLKRYHTKSLSTTLMPLGWMSTDMNSSLYCYYADGEYHPGDLNLYFSRQDSTVDRANLFFQSMQNKPSLFYPVPAIEKRKIWGLTGNEWKLSIDVESISHQLTVRNMSEILLMFAEQGRPKGCNLQIGNSYFENDLHGFDFSRLSQEAVRLNIYYEAELVAHLAKKFLQNLIQSKKHPVDLRPNKDPHGKREYCTHILLSVADFKSTEKIEKLKAGLHELLGEQKYLLFENMLTEIIQHSDTLKHSSKCRIM